MKSWKEDRLSSCHSLFRLYPWHGAGLTGEIHGLYFSSFSVYTREWIVFYFTAFLGDYSWFVFKSGRNKFSFTLQQKLQMEKKIQYWNVHNFRIPAFQASCITWKSCISVCSHRSNTGLGTGDEVIHRLFSHRRDGVLFSSGDFCCNLMSSISVLMYRKHGSWKQYIALIVYFHVLTVMDLIVQYGTLV